MLLLLFYKAPTPEPEPELTEADLPDIQESVRKLQNEYDEAVVVKHNLQNDVQSCSERLKAATGLLHRYLPQGYYRDIYQMVTTETCAEKQMVVYSTLFRRNNEIVFT